MLRRPAPMLSLLLSRRGWHLSSSPFLFHPPPHTRSAPRPGQVRCDQGFRGSGVLYPHTPSPADSVTSPIPVLQFHAANGALDLAEDVQRLGADHPHTRLVPDMTGGIDPDDVFRCGGCGMGRGRAGTNIQKDEITPSSFSLPSCRPPYLNRPPPRLVLHPPYPLQQGALREGLLVPLLPAGERV